MITLQKAKLNKYTNFYLALSLLIAGLLLMAFIVFSVVVNMLVHLNANEFLNKVFGGFISLVNGSPALGSLYLMITDDNPLAYLCLLLLIGGMFFLSSYFNDKRKYFKKLIFNYYREKEKIQSKISYSENVFNADVSVKNKNGKVNITNIINAQKDESNIFKLSLGVLTTVIGTVIAFYITKHI